MTNSSLIVCKFLPDSNKELLRQVELTYNDAFPLVERREFEDVVYLVRVEKRFNLELIMHSDKYVGFITWWDFGSFVYVEHFAIDAKHRNGGYGGRALALFIQQSQRRIVLEVEPPSDRIKIGRISFYKRNGFHYHSFPYKQPPYRPDDPMLPMALMTVGYEDPIDFETIKQTLYKHVYKWSY
ncbi:hypothetical protein A9168_08080 [Macellibacteroides sp. HH-ZS]|nr:hypothetical protein A9168_08080 [Macellibacteroides sp. HH-ZS]